MRRAPKPKSRGRKIVSESNPLVHVAPKPLTRDRKAIIKRKNAQTFLQKIGDKAKGLVQDRNDTQKDLTLTADIHKMILEDEEQEKKKEKGDSLGLHESNHPYVNSFNRLRGVGPSPPFTSDMLQKMINKRTKTQKLIPTHTRIGMTLNQPGKIVVKTNDIQIPEKFKSKAQRKREKKTKKKRSKRKSEVAPLTMTLRSRKSTNDPFTQKMDPTHMIQDSVSQPKIDGLEVLPKKHSRPKPVKRFTRVKKEKEAIPDL